MMLGDDTYTFVMIKNPKHNPNEPYIYFISDLQDAKAIATHYLKRWKIECCFKNLKTNGFNLEDINLRSDPKIELMIGILAMIYLIAIREGMLKHLTKPIALKKYKDGTTHLIVSLFRTGYAMIQYVFDTIVQLINYLEDLLKCPLYNS
jgi:transposase